MGTFWVVIITLEAKKNLLTLRRKGIIFALLAIFPSFLIISVISFYPLINGLILSFTDYKLGQQTPAKWIGISNYVSVFSSSIIWDSLGATLYFALMVVTGVIVIGMALALLLNRDFKGRAIARTLLIVPWAVPFFVSALLFRWLFDLQYGLVNYLLKSLFIIRANIGWLSQSPFFAMLSISIAFIWRLYPFNMVTFLASLETVDPVYYEVASIDGANRVQKFFHVTFPAIRNTFFTTVILDIVWVFQEFTLVWIMTEGSLKTEVLSIFVYRNAFMSLTFPKAAVGGALYCILLLVFAVIYIRLLLRIEGEE